MYIQTSTQTYKKPIPNRDAARHFFGVWISGRGGIKLGRILDFYNRGRFIGDQEAPKYAHDSNMTLLPSPQE